MGAANLDLLTGFPYISHHIDLVQWKRNAKKKGKKLLVVDLLASFFFLLRQDNYNALHVAAMYSREDVVKLLLSKRSVDPYATGGV